MNPHEWLKLPWHIKAATLVAGVFFGQRFDQVGHSVVVEGAWVTYTPERGIELASSPELGHRRD